MSGLLERWRTEVGDAYVVSLVRAILGLLLLFGALREASELADSVYFADIFHLPIVPEWLVPSRSVFVGLVLVQCALAVLVTIGRSTRISLLASAIIGIFLLLCDRLQYHNNRYAIFLFSFLIAFAPCDRAFVLHRKRPPATDRAGPLWAQRLMQVQLAVIYVASGGSKLLDPDWRSGLVIGDRLTRSTALAISKGVPADLMGVLADPSVASALSKLAIATELCLAVALFGRATRPFALWWGTLFHITIEITSKVELFGWLSLTMYALFAVPRLRERTLIYDPARTGGAFVARALALLDWLARFEIRADPTSTSGAAWAVVDRDGSWSRGIAALANVARATPVLFPLWIPLLLIAKLRGQIPLRAGPKPA